ncbi:hypothetical protein [Terriglobus albidus]|uniref:hypothetical protein n=1 Tax=Terriglobus albidus TaxID=1592106 RepID=UPI0021DFD4A2|nr:hypothetical protein [Terriglobus albidus]
MKRLVVSRCEPVLVQSPSRRQRRLGAISKQGNQFMRQLLVEERRRLECRLFK